MAAQLFSRYPWVTKPFVVCAPMRVMSGPALAVAVSRAGGLGFIGPGAQTSDTTADLEHASNLIREARASSSDAFPALPTSLSPLPIGVGYQLWADDMAVAAAAIGQYAPCAAWLFAPRDGPSELEAWSRAIRAASPATQIWIQIGTLQEARQLLQLSAKPDVVVVQGAEAGGHGRAADGMGLVTLLPEIADAIMAAGSRIPLFAAGGIADGRGVAAALALGAEGAVMGTRFLAAREARIRRGYQAEVVRAADGAVATTRTLLYNHLRGTFGWPVEYSPRTIINRSLVEHLAGKAFAELKVLHDQAAEAGDAGWGPEGRLATYAGAAVGLIHDVRAAEDIVRGVQADAVERLRMLASGEE